MAVIGVGLDVLYCWEQEMNTFGFDIQELG